jgi:hypothetical protein
MMIRQTLIVEELGSLYRTADTIGSKSAVGRTAAALGRHPVDVLRGVFDVASLAVNAVLRIDLQPTLAILTAVLNRNKLVDTCNRPYCMSRSAVSGNEPAGQ